MKRAKQEGTEAAFIRSRRDSVANATPSLNMADLAFDMDEHPATNDKVSEYWTESYEVEYQFQKSKQTHYKVDGVLDGLIDQNAVDQETMETAAKAERDADKGHIRDRREKIQGSKAWLDPAISVADLQVAMSARNLVKTTERLEADIFIVNDAGNLPERVKLMAALLGRQIMDVCLLEGKKGILLKFQPASQTRRQKVFFSTKFRESHAQFIKPIKDIVNRPGSKWKLAAVRADATMILATSAEVGRAAVLSGNSQGYLSKASFLENISRLDLRASGFYTP